MDFADIAITAVLAIIGYLCGTLPSGLMVARYLDIADPRGLGSGNIGATNMLRTGGQKAGVMTLLLDVFKGALPVAIALLFNITYLPYIVGVAALFGHIFPVWLNFRGGKGVATGFGILLTWNPMVAVMTLLCWIVIAILSRTSALAAVIAVSHASLYALIWGDHRTALFCLPIAALIIFRHHGNIRRLLNGEENQFPSNHSVKTSHERV